ncbi:MAG: (Fe-S)-binding protein [Planctomycetaceae bacterium]
MSRLPQLRDGVSFGGSVAGGSSSLPRRYAPRGQQQTGAAPGWFERWILYGLFPYPRRLRWALAPARVMQWLRLDRLMEAIGLDRLLPEKLRRMQRLLPRLRPRGPELPDFLPAVGEKRARVALFTGCVADAMFPHVNRATARVLQLNGCDVIIPRGQVCCGAIHYHSGAGEEALRLAEANAVAFDAESVDAVIINVAGCGSMLKDYAHVAHELRPQDDAVSQRLGTFARKVQDVSEFLMRLGLRPPVTPVRLKATYHDACHLAHAQRVREQPRGLLQLVPGLELAPLAESDICCGAAGSYNLVEPEMADRLGERKRRNIEATGAEAVICGNAGCTLQIAAELRHRGRDIPVLHPVEVLAAAYEPESA